MRRAWLGRVPYRWGHRLQTLRREAILEGRAEEVLWLLEHPPVITVGRRAVSDLPPSDTLRELGLEVVSTERGGLATWHGPGQLVGYLLADLGRRRLGLPGLVTALEAGLIAWLATRGIQAEADPSRRGVWIGPRKIASIGLHVRRGVTLHGFALNLTADLQGFRAITPCGLSGVEMISLDHVTGCQESPSEAWNEVADHIVAALAAASL